MLELFSMDRDNVINGYVCTGRSDYGFALKNLVPLIGKLDIQRDSLRTNFYSRLEEDILRGCVMPQITIALVHKFDNTKQTKEKIFNHIKNNLSNAFVLDGIQRLTTLTKAANHLDFDQKRVIHINFIITESRDKLLYRMITLNNGQKPMSARHQIEILANTFFDLDHIDLVLVPEKGKGRARSADTFKKADFVKGYIAYLSKSTNIDNQKIIEEKMDELIANRIIDSSIPSDSSEFSDVVNVIKNFSKNPEIEAWIKNANNFIGFCVGARKSLSTLQETTATEFGEAISIFESAFASINISKVKVAKVRRELVSDYISNYEKLGRLDEYKLLDHISEKI